MPCLRLLAAGAGALALALPSVAHAGGVSSNGTTITFTGGAGAESVTFNADGGQTVGRTQAAMTPCMSCTIISLQEMSRAAMRALSASTLGADDSIDARKSTDCSTRSAVAGRGSDEVSGNRIADFL